MTNDDLTKLEESAAHLPLMLPIKTVMREANCSEATVYRAFECNELESVKRGKRRLVPKHAFLSWLASFEKANRQPEATA